MVKSMIELHGGRVEITSDVGAGTTATLIFPADRVLDGGRNVDQRAGRPESVVPTDEPMTAA